MYKFSANRRAPSPGRPCAASSTALHLRTVALAGSVFVSTAFLSLVAPNAFAEETPKTKTESAASKPSPTKSAGTTAAETKKAPAAEPLATTKSASPAETTQDGDAAQGGDAVEGPSPAPAPTAEEEAEAKVAFEAGTKAFGAEDYAAAVTEFRKAHDAVPSVHAEYWIARSLDAADPENKNVAEVVAAYSKFLSSPGAQEAGAERVTESQARVVELKKLLPAQIQLSTVPEGAAITIDGQPHQVKTPATLELPAGSHKFEISLEGYEPTTVEMDVQGGSAVEQNITLVELPPPLPEPAPVEPLVTEPAPKRSLVPAAVTLGLGGAGLISGTLFGIMALGAKKDFKDDPTTENADTAERNALIADMSFGIALTLGITGVVLLTAEDEEAAAEAATKRRVLVAPYAGKKGGGLAGLLRF